MLRKSILQVLENDLGLGDWLPIMNQGRYEAPRIELQVLRSQMLAYADLRIHNPAFPFQAFLGQRDANFLRRR